MIIIGYVFYYVAALIGISIGYHRYFTHRSFTTTPQIEVLMLFLGQICGGRSALTWAAVHRMHHANSDTEHDPHSPKFVGWWRVLSSTWEVKYIPKKHIRDLLKNPRVMFFHKHGGVIHLTYAVIIFLTGFSSFVSFVIIPYVLAWIGFGLLNLLAHKDGHPVNLPILNLIAPGEGWHKYHHEHPMHYKLSKYDIAGWLIETAIIKQKSSD